MGTQIKNYTYNLFSRSSFLTGMGRIFDFSNSYNNYNISETSTEADFKAIASDWNAVGEDLKLVINIYGGEEKGG